MLPNASLYTPRGKKVALLGIKRAAGRTSPSYSVLAANAMGTICRRDPEPPVSRHRRGSNRERLEPYLRRTMGGMR